MTIHVIQEGEHMSLIAAKYGFENFETLWNAPENAQLRTVRESPHILMPGDEVFVPQKTERAFTRQTGGHHEFRVKVHELEVRIQIRDAGDHAVAGASCSLQLDGESRDEPTDAEGVVLRRVDRACRSGLLAAQGRETALDVGALHPLDEPSGVRRRLTNLGYDAGDDDDPTDERLRWAIEEFQLEHGVVPTGELDEALLVKLREVHGC